jgi:hypothetical protein
VSLWEVGNAGVEGCVDILVCGTSSGSDMSGTMNERHL